ncbi:hypothetical protein [Cytobacillus oceanisediminis]|uniref:hypothetical protein n=1 Tax=Cytobacillus oceanisediminis TaxID=665099 RepID=UPI003735FFD9
MNKENFNNKLKEVNQQASEVVKAVKETNDFSLIEALIHKLANDAWMLGVKDGRLDMAEDVANRVKELAEKEK